MKTSRVSLYLLCVVLIVLIIYVYYRHRNENRKSKLDEELRDYGLRDYNIRESNKPSVNVGIIHNHLRKPITLHIGIPNKQVEHKLDVPENSKSTIDLKYLNKGMEVIVYTSGGKSASGIPLVGELYTQMVLQHDLNDLHIGMVTTRWVAGDPGMSQNTQANGAMINGMPYIRIHNMTEQTLLLNRNISIAPHNVLHYRGEDAGGISLGLWLYDKNKLYPKEQILKPVTDVYYGVSSPIKQAFYGNISYVADPNLLLDDQDAGNYGMSLFEDGYY